MFASLQTHLQKGGTIKSHQREWSESPPSRRGVDQLGGLCRVCRGCSDIGLNRLFFTVDRVTFLVRLNVALQLDNKGPPTGKKGWLINSDSKSFDSPFGFYCSGLV